MKSDEKRKAQEAAGIPDSRANRSDEVLATGETRILGCHINGIQIAALNLPPEVIAALDYFATDEGVAERNARPQMREPSGVTLGQDPFSKALEQKTDDVLERDMYSYEARDPLREVAEQYAVPGMRAKFMSAAKIKAGGNRDYVVVKEENGDPVRVKGMILGHIPEERAVARNKHYQKLGNQFLKQIGEEHVAQGGVIADQ